jgi:ABC-type branched-subunit amino acid transport system ATPase component
MTDPQLQLRGVTKRFGGLTVLSDFDLEVGDGEVVSVIGPNGAGKTTLFNLITGVDAIDSGTICVGGRSVAGYAPHQITGLGIARTFQTIHLFLNMSVIDNVMVGAHQSFRTRGWQAVLRTPSWRRDERAHLHRAEELLAFFGDRLGAHRYHQPAYALSYANRRRLEIARAMATGAKVLLLDEPAAGMNPVEKKEIGALIARLRSDLGYTVLVIEHDMGVVQGISDRVIALDHGVKIAEGSFGEVSSHPTVIEAYLGRRHEEGGGAGVVQLALEGDENSSAGTEETLESGEIVT